MYSRVRGVEVGMTSRVRVMVDVGVSTDGYSGVSKVRETITSRVPFLLYSRVN